jgi:bifunctional enzyme CysN/CysC
MAPATQPSAIDTFLDHYRRRELLRFLTCGSVDDGKSTLIGRLLHDSQGVYDDQLSAARRDSVKHGTTGGELDLALLVDGLQAEREQGITIDVAYRYFSTPRRKFIIADTPGHEQYTRNMATGASTCDLAVILVDATRGVLDQTRRHAFIATLLGIRHLVVAINKMDLVDYSEARFESIREDFAGFAAKLQVGDVHFIPISALKGDNVVHGTDAMPWYRGGPLLDYLETLHIASDRNLIDLRLPVQLVVRPSAEFRGYAGSLASGVLRPGDAVTVLPSGRQTSVRSIHTIDGEKSEAFAPMPVTVTLADEVDASRGDMLVSPNNAPRVEQEFEAMLVWMHDEPAATKREYLLKQTTVLVPALISEVRYRINVNTLHRETCDELRLNEIGRVRIETPRLLAFDSYVRNRATGAFILIDRITNATVAAGMILDRDPAEMVASTQGAGKRTAREPFVLLLEGDAASEAVGRQLEESLRSRGVLAWALDRRELSTDDPAEAAGRCVSIVTAMRRIGAISILPRESALEAALSNAGIEAVRHGVPDGPDAAGRILEELAQQGLLSER